MADRLTAAEIRELDEVRREDDLTYRKLALAIGRISSTKVFELLNNPRPAANDRTVYKVRAFLERRRADLARVPVRRTNPQLVGSR